MKEYKMLVSKVALVDFYFVVFLKPKCKPRKSRASIACSWWKVEFTKPTPQVTIQALKDAPHM